MAGDREKCLEAGMNDHVAKPIEPDKLFEALVRWIVPREPEIQPADRAQSGKQADKDNLPDSLDGIDTAEGLRRVGGNRKLYRKLLVDFFQDHSNDARRIRQALDQNDLETAQRIAHTIKGVSGSIGAGDLHREAANLDSAFREGRQDRYAELLSRLEGALRIVMQGLNVTALPDGAERSAVQIGDPMDVEAVMAALDELQTLLEEMDPEAEDKVAGLKAQLSGGLLQRLVNELSKQVSEFEFENACETLAELKNALEKG
jgi:two-component system, sensor histidine kinase and response regulator